MGGMEFHVSICLFQTLVRTHLNPLYRVFWGHCSVRLTRELLAQIDFHSMRKVPIKHKQLSSKVEEIWLMKVLDNQIRSEEGAFNIRVFLNFMSIFVLFRILSHSVE